MLHSTYVCSLYVCSLYVCSLYVCTYIPANVRTCVDVFQYSQYRLLWEWSQWLLVAWAQCKTMKNACVQCKGSQAAHCYRQNGELWSFEIKALFDWGKVRGTEVTQGCVHEWCMYVPAYLWKVQQCRVTKTDAMYVRTYAFTPSKVHVCMYVCSTPRFLKKHTHTHRYAYTSYIQTYISTDIRTHIQSVKHTSTHILTYVVQCMGTNKHL